MASTRKTLLIGTVTALEAGCLLGVACLGRGMFPLERASAASEPVPVETISWENPARPMEAAQPDLEAVNAGAQRAPGGAAIADRTAGEGVRSDTAEVLVPSKESEFYADFLKIAARGPEVLEGAARVALAEDGPNCRKVAALRALRAAGCPAADDILVAAISDLPDTSGPNSESVPRFALRSLLERAPVDPGARQALGRVAWNGGKPAGSALRAAAVAALAATATELEIPRVADRLRSETDPLVLEGAIEALSRNPQTAAAEAALRSLGMEAPLRGDPVLEDIRERQD